MDLWWGVQTFYMEALLSELVRFPRRCLVGFGFTHPPVNSGFRNIAEREAERREERTEILHTQLPISGAAFMKDTDEFETDQEDEQEVDQAAYPEADLEAVKSVQWPLILI